MTENWVISLLMFSKSNPDWSRNSCSWYTDSWHRDLGSRMRHNNKGFENVLSLYHTRTHTRTFSWDNFSHIYDKNLYLVHFAHCSLIKSTQKYKKIHFINKKDIRLQPILLFQNMLFNTYTILSPKIRVH